MKTIKIELDAGVAHALKVYAEIATLPITKVYGCPIEKELEKVQGRLAYVVYSVAKKQGLL